MRLFFALELPEAAQQSLHELAWLNGAAKTSARSHLRAVPPENLHLTLAFLGEVPADRLAAIQSAAAGVECVGPVALQPTGLGFFPPRGAPRVLVAHLGGDHERLGRYQAALQSALEPIGFEPERRPFKPHITIARVRDPRQFPRDLREAITCDSQLLEQRYLATTVTLYQSTLTPAGAVYAAAGRFPL